MEINSDESDIVPSEVAYDKRTTSACSNISYSEVTGFLPEAMEPKPDSIPIISNNKTRTRWAAAAIGQMLSLILCVSAVTSVYLTDVYNLHISNAQNFVFYVLLSAIFTSALACRPESGNLFSVMKYRGWKYFLLAVADAEANYLVVKAYQYTTLTSVQLLDCFTIPTVLLLSCILLGVRYRACHLIGVIVCLLGVCCLVWADTQEGIPFGQGSERLLGDLLCLSGAFLYGVSNVAQEFLVKTFDIVEFLGMIGLFGSAVTGMQAVLFEYDQVTSAVVNGSPMPLALLGGYALAQLSFYVLAAFMMKLSGATTYNLSILTADFYSLIVGIFLFQYQFHALYFMSFLFVIIGVVMFSLKPTIQVLSSELDNEEQEPLIGGHMSDNNVHNESSSSTSYNNYGT
ncbi:unnamed protein product [Orchesella dallaii]|uniref:Solute carrier family 35 member F1 n=1 Tax=Orchesella dallaii TaxID=48710 RepID=A0ABP1QC50_9HEXA